MPLLTKEIEILQAKLKSTFGLEMVEIHYARQSKGSKNAASQGEVLVHLASNDYFILALKSKGIWMNQTPCLQ